MWDITKTLWKHRNDVEHGIDANNSLSAAQHILSDEEIDLILERIPALLMLPVTLVVFSNRQNHGGKI